MNEISNIQKSLLVMAVSLLLLSAASSAFRGYYRFNDCMDGYLFRALKLSQLLALVFFAFASIALVYFLIRNQVKAKRS